LADRGARVAVFDVAADPARIAERFGERRTDERLLFVQADVTQRRSIEAGLGQVERAWGIPHALINNAALDAPPNASTGDNGPFERYTEGAWDRVMQVNVKGVFLCCQAIGAKMAEAGRGSIVNIGSIYGEVSPDQRIYEFRHAKGEPFYKPVAYATSKSALANLTRYLATYWASKNVRVNTLTFGGVFNGQEEPLLKAYGARVPMGRMAREDEYNGAIVFLVSDASSYMTGSNMIIDGGWTAW
jgi:NAD(P)-dependent dehydrogenase (short-subunit alcohol dehydrogenase family)